MMKNSKIVLMIGATLLVLSLCIIGWSRSQSGDELGQKTGITDSSMKKNDPEPTPQEAEVKHVIVHTGLTEAQLSSPQDHPYDVLTAQGHYLVFLTPDSESGITEKLIYDGQEIPLGGELVSLGLSSNGLHYTYAIDRGSSDDLYVDGRKVSSDTRIDQPRVTDDGQHYYYISQAKRDVNSGVYVSLKKDSQEIYSYADGILSFQISSDGSHYLAELRHKVFSGTDYGAIASYDGKEIKTVRNIRDGELSLSDDGEHYGYVLSGQEGGKEELVVDGEKRLESRTLYSLQVADNGGYVVTAPEDKMFYTSEKDIPMRSDSSADGVTAVIVNEDMSHLLTLDAKWYLDDDQVDIEDKGTVELVGSSIYTYEVTK